MNTYQVKYKVGKNGYIYPKGIAKAVWLNAQYNDAEKMFVAETNNAITADGTAVVLLNKADAVAVIDRLKVVDVKVLDPLVIQKL